MALHLSPSARNLLLRAQNRGFVFKTVRLAAPVRSVPTRFSAPAARLVSMSRPRLTSAQARTLGSALFQAGLPATSSQPASSGGRSWENLISDLNRFLVGQPPAAWQDLLDEAVDLDGALERDEDAQNLTQDILDCVACAQARGMSWAAEVQSAGALASLVRAVKARDKEKTLHAVTALLEDHRALRELVRPLYARVPTAGTAVLTDMPSVYFMSEAVKALAVLAAQGRRYVGITHGMYVVAGELSLTTRARAIEVLGEFRGMCFFGGLRVRSIDEEIKRLEAIVAALDQKSTRALFLVHLKEWSDQAIFLAHSLDSPQKQAAGRALMQNLVRGYVRGERAQKLRAQSVDVDSWIVVRAVRDQALALGPPGGILDARQRLYSPLLEAVFDEIGRDRLREIRDRLFALQGPGIDMAPWRATMAAAISLIELYLQQTAL